MCIPDPRQQRETLAVAVILGLTTGCPSSESPRAPSASVGSADTETTPALRASKGPSAGPSSSSESAADHGRYGAKRYALSPGCGPDGQKFSCNPLTNDGCSDDQDEVCDDDDHEAFACFPDSDGVNEGGDCDDKSGPSCAPGMTCDPMGKSGPRGVCKRFCCSSSDCRQSKTSKKCVPLDPEFGTLGVCK